ncbi:MAG: mechanosensitive ion channel, partial [Pyrinomonadaceae bacterium]|nr:mechanosensitive ion channel [Pyrinomonadaceae bacterium]
VWTSLEAMLANFAARLPYLAAAILVLLAFWLLSRLLKRFFLAAGSRTTIDIRLRILFGRIIAGVVIFIGILAALTIVIPSFSLGNLIAGLGFTSVVVGFAAKDIVNNFLSGILILLQRPFQIGDYLFVGSNQGRVEYIGVRASSLRKDDGELILIPNGDMYSSALIIRGKGTKRRMNLKFELGFDEDIERAKEVTRAAIDATEGVESDPSPRVIVTDLAATGVTVTSSFWLNTKEESPQFVFDRVAVNVLRALDVAAIRVFSKPIGDPAEPEPEPAIKKEDLFD